MLSPPKKPRNDSAERAFTFLIAHVGSTAIFFAGHAGEFTVLFLIVGVPTHWLPGAILSQVSDAMAAEADHSLRAVWRNSYGGQVIFDYSRECG